jgi:hypothetical protein
MKKSFDQIDLKLKEVATVARKIQAKYEEFQEE